MIASVSSLATVGISAGVAAAVSIVTLWVNGGRQERARRRELYAAALAATMAYREFPYAIVRRRPEQEHRSAERVRISESLREVQANIAQHQALLRVERSNGVTRAYNELVGKTREIAGGYMKDAWEGPAAESDKDVNRRVPRAYGTLDTYVEAYLTEVKKALRWWSR